MVRPLVSPWWPPSEKAISLSESPNRESNSVEGVNMGKAGGLLRYNTQNLPWKHSLEDLSCTHPRTRLGVHSACRWQDGEAHRRWACLDARLG